MANQETKILDNVISSRRALLVGGGALAAMALTMPKTASAAATVTTYTDSDILNFALNLEYLEANFYYLAAFGTTIDKSNPASIAAGGPAAGIGIGAGTAITGTPATFGIGGAVPFLLPVVAAYAYETAIEEGKHVILLRNALGPAAAAQPALDISPAAFTVAANAAGIAGAFNPYAADAFFLLGAYIFEDVGVSAYHGAASLIKSASILSTAASILAVEAYHAGLVRTTINALDPTDKQGYLTITQKISTLRASLSLAALGTAPNPDDFGLVNKTVMLNTSASVPSTQIVDADANVLAFSRNTNQVLNIVTGGGVGAAGTPAKGLFFPAGLTGTFV